MVLETLGLMEPDLRSALAHRLVIPTVMESVLGLQKLSDLVRQKLMVVKDLAQENFHPPMLELFSQIEMRP
jgi:hypothetical protein